MSFFEFDSCLVEIPSLGVTTAWLVAESDWSLVRCRAFVLKPRRFFVEWEWRPDEVVLFQVKIRCFFEFDSCLLEIQS